MTKEHLNDSYAGRHLGWSKEYEAHQEAIWKQVKAEMEATPRSTLPQGECKCGNWCPQLNQYKKGEAPITALCCACKNAPCTVHYCAPYWCHRCADRMGVESTLDSDEDDEEE